MKVKILRTCSSSLGHHAAGETYDVPDKIGRELCSARRAVVLDSPVETRDPQIAIGDEAESIIKKSSRTPK